jgi:phenylalanyl-tRNA synthetase beta chain
MSTRLQAAGVRPINTIVDITNYVLVELGHPTHAFDLDLLTGGRIVVRRARPGEKLRNLDGVERQLHPEDLVIADAEKPVALAGVMGGLESAISERTRNVLIESAWFDPATVRKTAKRHGMHTDASHRFERGADWGSTSLACARVAELIVQSADGQLEGGEIDVIARKVGSATVELRRSEIQRILGDVMPEQETARILRRLGFAVTSGRASITVPAGAPLATIGSGGAHAAIAEEPTAYSVQVPSWRLDVEREIDLIEELARIYGYNRFPNTLPAFSGEVVELPRADKDEALRSTLLALGYNEAVSLTFISREEAQEFGGEPVIIANPLSEEAAAMRTSLVPLMIDMLARNLNRGNDSARLFELGHVFEQIGERTEERAMLCFGGTGNAVPGSVHEPARAYGFFDMKGDLEQLLERFEYRAVYFDANTPKYFHPGRSARAVLEGSTVAHFGEISPELQATRKLRQPVYVAEVYLERLYSKDLRRIRYMPVPRFPAVERDFSFVFPNDVTFDRIRQAVHALRIPDMRDFAPVEIFRGGSVPSGSYSLLLRARFQSSERTLRDEEVAEWAAQIIKTLEGLSGTLRS